MHATLAHHRQPILQVVHDASQATLLILSGDGRDLGPRFWRHLEAREGGIPPGTLDGQRCQHAACRVATSGMVQSLLDLRRETHGTADHHIWTSTVICCASTPVQSAIQVYLADGEEDRVVINEDRIILSELRSTRGVITQERLFHIEQAHRERHHVRSPLILNVTRCRLTAGTSRVMMFVQVHLMMPQHLKALKQTVMQTLSDPIVKTSDSVAFDHVLGEHQLDVCVCVCGKCPSAVNTSDAHA